MNHSRRFDEETRSFLQRRLRLLAGSVAALTTVLLLAFIAATVSQHDASLLTVLWNYATRFPNSVLFGLVVVTGCLYVTLRAFSLSSRALAIIDGLVLQALFAPCLILYARLHTFSFSGFSVVVDFLLLFIFTRAILIPSTALRTILLSAPAPLGVFIIQTIYGVSLAFPDQPYNHAYHVDLVIQHQVLLLGAIGIAAIASRVNLGLRRRTYDAKRLGQYEMQDRIGAGGMGEVYRATHALLKRPTAVKLLRPDLAGREALRRFEEEVRQTSRLTHPNTVSIYDYGHTAEGLFYYAMELLEGAHLRQIVETTGPMPPARVIHVLTGACGALQEAHSKGLVHRDLKAENIMLCEQGGEPDVVKILDFGLVLNLRGASHGRPDSVSGTPETIAPETLTGGAIGPPTDLYSLSAVGCFLLTGRPIFDAKSVSEMLKAHQCDPPIPPSVRNHFVPKDLESVLLTGLRKNPAERPSSAKVLRERLLSCRDAGGWTSQRAAAWWSEFSASPPKKLPARSPHDSEQTLAPDSRTLPSDLSLSPTEGGTMDFTLDFDRDDS